MSDVNEGQAPRPRWFTDTKEGHAQWYIERFRALAAQGADLEGEARFADMMAPRHARILDAGCGPGRMAGALAAAGHLVFGFDVDPELIQAATEDNPGPIFSVVDLSELTLDDLAGDPVDLVVCGGNVMVFTAAGTEREVVRRLASVVVPGGRVVIGYRRDEAYPYERFDADLAELGLTPEFRFSTWHLDPFDPEHSDFQVCVIRV